MVVGEMAHERELIIIGGGPGGYHAAIRAAQLGKMVTLIEKDQLGGICLNKGCIPSKLLTSRAKKWRDLLSADEMGFDISSISLNAEKHTSYKNKIINQLKQGIEALCKANKVEIIKGNAFFMSENRIGVEQADSFELYQFENAIIATGSTPVNWPRISFDGKKILDSWTISSLEEVPEHLAIYGSDTNALEMAMAFRALGAEITLLLETGKNDFGFDSSINREIKRIFKKEKISIIKECELIGASEESKTISLEYTLNGTEKVLSCSHLFLSTGVNPNISELGIERLGMELTEEGFISVDRQCRTSLKHIFAVGDITAGPPLAVKAISQGKTAAEAIAGLNTESDLRYLPKVIHTLPPIASVGMTEEEAEKEGYVLQIGQFPLAANGYTSLSGKRDGFVKVISDQKTDVILGIHIIGEGAIEMISAGTISLEMAARDEDMTFPLYPHPSINEALLEAVEQLKGRAVHVAPLRKQEKVKL